MYRPQHVRQRSNQAIGVSCLGDPWLGRVDHEAFATTRSHCLLEATQQQAQARSAVLDVTRECHQAKRLHVQVQNTQTRRTEPYERRQQLRPRSLTIGTGE